MSAARGALVLVLGITLFTGGCSRDHAERMSFPGFSLEIPAGKISEDSKSPVSGKRKIDLDAPSLVERLFDHPLQPGAITVTWSNEKLDRAEWRELYLPALAAALATQAPGSKVLRDESIDDRRWLVLVGTEKIPVAVGVVRCHDRFLVQILYARYADAERQTRGLRNAMDSVRCAVAVANLEEPRFAVRLPATFGRLDNSEMQTYPSVDGEFVGVSSTQGNIQKDPKLLRPVLLAVLSNALGYDPNRSRVDEVTNPRRPGPEPATLYRLTALDKHESTYVGVVWCERAELTGMMIWRAAEMTDARAAERFGQIGCPGDTGQEPPPFAPLVDAACKQGNSTACAIQQADAR